MRLTWLPNLLSLANLFFGFTAMLAALRGRFDLSAIFIFASMIFDMLDGRVARMIKDDNPIGQDLDSFADLVAFGIAPGVIFYAAFMGHSPVYPDLFTSITEYNLNHLLIGSLAFIFPLCASLRLARFNIATEHGNSFRGLPSPIAGGLVVFLSAYNQVPGFFIKDGFLEPLNFSLPYWLMIVVFLLIAFLMISRIPFQKPQKLLFNFRGFSNLGVGIAFNLLVVVMIVLFFKFFLLITALIYIGSTLLKSLKAAPEKSAT